MPGTNQNIVLNGIY